MIHFLLLASLSLVPPMHMLRCFNIKECFQTIIMTENALINLATAVPHFIPVFNVRLLFYFQGSGKQTLREFIMYQPKQAGKQVPFQVLDNETSLFLCLLIQAIKISQQTETSFTQPSF